MSVRERLSARRQNCSIPFVWGGRRYEVTCGFYDDGRVAEAFVSNVKAGTDIQSISRDAAIILSMALQYGCPLETIRDALTRDDAGGPTSLVGGIVDAVCNNVGGEIPGGAGRGGGSCEDGLPDYH